MRGRWFQMFTLATTLGRCAGAVDSPAQPLAAVIGGAKVSTKVPVIASLLGKCHHVFLGGGMIFTFFRAMGLQVRRTTE